MCPTSPQNDWHPFAGVSLLGSSVAFAFVGVTGTQWRLRKKPQPWVLQVKQSNSWYELHTFLTWRCWICNKCWVINGSKSQFVALRPPWLYTKLCGQHRTICQRKGRSGRSCHVYDFGRICDSFFEVPSLKLTVRTWNLMVGRLLFFGKAKFQVRTVSFREGKASNTQRSCKYLHVLLLLPGSMVGNTPPPPKI